MAMISLRKTFQWKWLVWYLLMLETIQVLLELFKATIQYLDIDIPD